MTLGFGFKSYVGCRMRQRKQRDVAKENEFYMQLMQQALPVTEAAERPLQAPPSEQMAVVSTAVVPTPATTSVVSVQTKVPKVHEKNGHIPNGTVANGVHPNKQHHRKSVDKCKEHDEHNR